LYQAFGLKKGRIIEHAEKSVCPAIMSNPLIGGNPFVFSGATKR
jgi:hypothetical protein